MNLGGVPDAYPEPLLWVNPAAPASRVDAAVSVDRVGRPLWQGSAVLIHWGRHAGQVAEVVGCGGCRGVEVVVHGVRPAFLTLQPAVLELVDAVMLDPVFRRRSRPRPKSAAAGGSGQGANGAAREPELRDTGLDGMGASLTIRPDHEHLRA
jgi:hypothetical protein